MIIKKDRVPLKFLIFAQHSHLKRNRFSTEDILRFFRDNPVYIGTMIGIGRTVPQNKIRSFLRGLPGNISMVLNAIGIVKGTDNYYYRLPDILFHPIKDGILRFKQNKNGDFEATFTNTIKIPENKFKKIKQNIEYALTIFLDRKTQEFKLRDYAKKGAKKIPLDEIVNDSRRIKQYYFEQRKACFETSRREHIYIPYPTIPYEEMLEKNPRIYYSIPKSFAFHPNCPNFVFKIFNNSLKYEGFYTIPFHIIDELVFQKLKPDQADLYYFCFKKRSGDLWLYYKDNTPLLNLRGYEKIKRIEDIQKAPYTAPYQNARLRQYRESLHAGITSTFEDKIALIKKYKEVNQEVNAVSYIECLSLAKALKIKQEKEEKTIFLVRVDTTYPDLLCIYLEDLTEEERFGKTVKKLDLMDLFLIRHNVIQNIEKYKARLFEIEAEYDAAQFSHHESPSDDITRSKFIVAWINNYSDKAYRTKTKIEIPIINAKQLWYNLIKEIQEQPA